MDQRVIIIALILQFFNNISTHPPVVVDKIGNAHSQVREKYVSSTRETQYAKVYRNQWSYSSLFHYLSPTCCTFCSTPTDAIGTLYKKTCFYTCGCSCYSTTYPSECSNETVNPTNITPKTSTANSDDATKVTDSSVDRTGMTANRFGNDDKNSTKITPETSVTNPDDKTKVFDRPIDRSGMPVNRFGTDDKNAAKSTDETNTDSMEYDEDDNIRPIRFLPVLTKKGITQPPLDHGSQQYTQTK